MNVYAESSAVLRWLLGEPDPEGVVPLLRRAGLVFTSELTLLECRRALARIRSQGTWSSQEVDMALQELDGASSHWTRFEIHGSVLDRAGSPFPLEPVRSLDAVHLATALQVHRLVPDLTVLTLDHRVRDNAEQLGLAVAP